MNLTKLRAERLTRELLKHAEQNRYMLRRVQNYHDAAKGGDASALMTLIRALNESDDALAQADIALKAAMKRKGWD